MIFKDEMDKSEKEELKEREKNCKKIVGFIG